MSTPSTQSKSNVLAVPEEIKFDWCPVCLGTSFEAQSFNTSGNLIESQELDAPCFVCNGAKVVSVDSICVCGRAASWRMLEGKLKGTMYCGRLGCLKRLQFGESPRRTLSPWREDGEDDNGAGDDYSRQWPF